MNIRLLALALVLSACVPHLPPGPAAHLVAEGPVALVGQPGSGPATHIYLSVRAGSAMDPVGQEGVASLAAQLLREGGAGERDGAAVDAALYALGTDIEVVVDKELVTFRTRALHGDMETAASILGDILLAPKLDGDSFLRLRSEARHALEVGIAQSDEALGLEVMDSWMHAGHPYGHPVEGRSGALEVVDVAAVKAFVADRYLRASVVLGVAGPCVRADGSIDTAAPGGAAVARLRGRLAGLSSTLPQAATPRAVPSVEGRRMLVIEKATEATGIHFGHPTELHRGHRDWPAMLLATTALGEHRQGHGRLYRALREARGLNYGDYAYLEVHREAGGSSLQETGSGRVQNPFHVWVRPVDAANGPFALKAAVALVEDFAEHGLDPAEFARMQRYLSGRISLWAADPGRRLGWAVEARAMGWPDPIATLPVAIEALSLEKVNEAIATHMQPENLKIVVITGDGASFEGKILEGIVTPLVYPGDGPAPGGFQEAEDLDYAGHELEVLQVNVLSTEELFR
jgi:zinc protease